MATIRHRVTVDAPLEAVYEAIATADGIGTWWDKQTDVQTDRGLVLEHDPGPEHGVVKLRVVALVPNRRVEWECVSTHPPTSPASAWTGTHFVFEIETDAQSARRPGSAGRATAVEFRQTGYDERSAFFGANDAAWGRVLANLKRVLESASR